MTKPGTLLLTDFAIAQFYSSFLLNKKRKVEGFGELIILFLKIRPNR